MAARQHPFSPGVWSVYRCCTGTLLLKLSASASTGWKQIVRLGLRVQLGSFLNTDLLQSIHNEVQILSVFSSFKTSCFYLFVTDWIGFFFSVKQNPVCFSCSDSVRKCKIINLYLVLSEPWLVVLCLQILALVFSMQMYCQILHAEKNLDWLRLKLFTNWKEKKIHLQSQILPTDTSPYCRRKRWI